MKFSAYSLLPSFTPFHSIILKKSRRFSLDTSTKARNLSTTCAKKHQLHQMVASRYLPPLFRWVCIVFGFVCAIQ